MPNLLQPGIYILSCDVKNPEGDLRVKREFKRLAVWETGTRLICRPSGILHSEVKGYEFMSLYPVGSYEFQGIVLKENDPQTNALLAKGVLLKEEKSIQEAFCLSGDESAYSPVLRKLMEAGKITIKDAVEALQAWHKEFDENEDNE